jgi:hypothetical membrane protein
MSYRTLGCWCGIVGPVLWLGLIALAGAMRPDFSHVTDYISELGERGSGTEVLVRFGAFVFTGFLYVCFAAGLLATFRHGWLQIVAALLIAMDGVGRIGAGVFPCDPGCAAGSAGAEFHRLFATIGFASGILATWLWGLWLGRERRSRPLAGLSMASGAVAFVALLLMARTDTPALPQGLLEHLATVALSIWTLALAIHVLRRRPETSII